MKTLKRTRHTIYKSFQICQICFKKTEKEQSLLTVISKSEGQSETFCSPQCDKCLVKTNKHLKMSSYPSKGAYKVALKVSPLFCAHVLLCSRAKAQTDHRLTMYSSSAGEVNHVCTQSINKYRKLIYPVHWNRQINAIIQLSENAHHLHSLKQNLELNLKCMVSCLVPWKKSSRKIQKIIDGFVWGLDEHFNEESRGSILC